MVHSEVYLNKYVVSIAPFSTPAFTPHPRSENCCFACFRFLIFHPFFKGGQLTPFAPMCGRPWISQSSVKHKPMDTHIHPFNGPFSGTTRVSRYQKGITSLDFTEARDSGWQWHQLGHMQVCTSLQTDNHASIPPLTYGRGRQNLKLLKYGKIRGERLKT